MVSIQVSTICQGHCSPTLQGAHSPEEICLNAVAENAMPKMLWKHRKCQLDRKQTQER